MSTPIGRLTQLKSQIFGQSTINSSPPPSAKVDPGIVDPTTFPEFAGRPPHLHALSPTLFLPRAADIEPDAPAIYHLTANKKILKRTYQDLADRARGLAYWLKRHGYKRVGLLAANTPGFLEAIFAITAAGGINVGVNYRLESPDITYIFEHSEVDLIIADAEFVHLLDQFRAANPKVAILVDTDTDADDGPLDKAILEGLDIDAQEGGEGWSALATEAEDEKDVIAIAYTSGTTSRPKGVQLTHRSTYLCALANVIESGLNYHQGRCRFMWIVPMFHAMGWTFPWAVTAVRGTHYCTRKVDYPQMWRLLKEERVTHFNAAPTVNTMLCAAKEAERLPEPVRVTVAASPPSAHLLQQMTDLNLHPVHVYGMTESNGPTTKQYHKPEWEDLPANERYQTVSRQGYAFVASKPVRVIKTDGDHDAIIDVEKNGLEVGEIVLTGNTCGSGYYKNVEATKELFRGGWLHTGDLAVWHPDGSIQIMDRQKDIIISGGENISSIALESMLMTHPDILEAGVIGLPDERWGETPKAFITVKSGKQIRGEEVIAWAKKSKLISGFMVPKEVEIVSELPKTTTGKVKKNVLREWTKGSAREL